MPKGPRGEKRPADDIGLAMMIGKFATGEAEDTRDVASSAASQLGLKDARGPCERRAPFLFFNYGRCLNQLASTFTRSGFFVANALKPAVRLRDKLRPVGNRPNVRFAIDLALLPESGDTTAFDFLWPG